MMNRLQVPSSVLLFFSVRFWSRLELRPGARLLCVMGRFSCFRGFPRKNYGWGQGKNRDQIKWR